MIEKGIREGLKATALYEQVRGTPLGIRKQDFLSLYREIADVPKKEETVKYTPTKYLFPKEGVRVEPWQLKQPILYKFETVLQGETEPRYFSLYSDRLMTIREAMEEMSRVLEEKSFEYKQELGIAGKRIERISALAPIVSREMGPAWLTRQYGRR